MFKEKSFKVYFLKRGLIALVIIVSMLFTLLPFDSLKKAEVRASLREKKSTCSTNETKYAIQPYSINAYNSVYPTVKYVKTNSRKMLYCNNPKQLITSDLADKNYGKKSIYRDNVYAGTYRAFYEHLNKTSKSLGYAIRIYNSNTKAITVTVYGRGFEASINGGKAFSDMFTNYSDADTVYTVQPGKVLYIQNNCAIKNGAFFSGVVDFDIRDKALINFFAYENMSNINSSLTYEGYIQRVESDGTHEARMYKGLSLYSMVKASNINFVINDNTKGILPVNISSYDLQSGSYTNKRFVTNGWNTNIAPGNNANAIHSDMLTFYTPGFGTIDPNLPYDGEKRFSNIANWGVQYVLEGTIKNTGSYARKITVNLKASSNSGITVAYRGNDSKWYSMRAQANTNIQYYTFVVPAGQTVSYKATFILGGPSGGNLTQSITVTN